jgi:hypothetical protein
VEVNLREWVARLCFAASVGLVAVGQLIGNATDPAFGDLVGIVAAFGFTAALIGWTLDSAVPIQARAADVAGAGLGVAATLLPWLLPSEQLATWPEGWQPALVIALLLVGTIARALQGSETALPVVALLGVGLGLLSGAEGYVQGELTRLSEVLLVGGGGLLVAYAALDARQVGETVGSRSFRYGGGAVLLTALAAGLAVGAYVIAERNEKTFDVTRDQAFTLSDQAQRVAGELAFDVEVTAFFRDSAQGRGAFASLIERFEEASPHISVEWVDPLRDPRRAAAAEITGEQGTVILRGNERERRLEWEITEDELVRALVMLGSEQDHQVCWSLGHGEPDPDDEFTAAGLGAVRLELEGLNYKVQKVYVGNTGIPRDCRVLVVARPTTPWFAYEREALAAYVAEGGRALLLLEPGTVPELAVDLERYGVLVGDDLVVDLDERNRLLGVEDPTFLVLQAERFGTHVITRSLGASVVASVARSVRASREPPEGTAVQDLLRTSPMAWAETDLQAASIGLDEGETTGELPIMAVVEVEDPAALRVATQDQGEDDAEPAPEPGAAEEAAPAGAEAEPSPAAAAPDEVPASRGVPEDFAPAAGGRLAVIGDADFATNQMVGLGNNRDLLLNAVAWLADEEDQIGERPEAGERLEIGIGASALWCLLSVGVIPGLAAAIAAMTMIRRSWL